MNCENTGLNLPLGHGVGLVLPVPGHSYPMGHAVHIPLPSVLYVPSGHFPSSSPEVQLYPAGQGVQGEVPSEA